MSPPNRQSLAEIAQELGIHAITLYKWRKAWRLQGDVVPASERDPCQATAKTGPDVTRNLAPLREPLIRANAMSVVLSPQEQSSRDAALETPEDVQAILGLTAAGWGRRRIAKELGCSPETVRKYRRQGGWEAYGKPRRIGVLDGHSEWLRERFLAHNGNADVVRQELASEKGLAVSLRTVERAVGPWRLRCAVFHSCAGN
jgi:transposase-like protein